MDNQRNLILAVVLSAMLLFGWDAFSRWYFPQPERAVVAQSAAPVADTQAADDKLRHSRTNREGGLHNAGDIALERKELATELAATDRIAIDAPEVKGSINPVGARIDDLTFNKYRQAVDKSSGPVRLFSPAGTPAQHYAQFGFVGGANGDEGGSDGLKLPDANTVWQASAGRSRRASR